MGYVGKKYEKTRTREKRIENAKTDVCRQIERLNADLRNRFGVEFIGDVMRSSSYVGLGMWNVNQARTG